MPCNDHLERTREFVTQVFHELEGGPALPLRETVVVRDGCYCGRRFASAELSAVWFLEEAQVKFYGPDGSLLKVASLTESMRKPHAA